MTNSTTATPTAVRLTAPHSFFGGAGVLREWAEGECAYDPAEIAMLTARGAPIEPIGAIEDAGLFRVAALRPLRTLATELGRAAQCVEAGHGVGASTSTFLPDVPQAISDDAELTVFIDAFDAKVRALLDHHIGAIRAAIAVRDTLVAS